MKVRGFSKLFASSAFALAAITLAPPATAQEDDSPRPDFADPVAICVHQIATIAHNGTEEISQTAQQGVMAIKRLDEAGAPNEAIVEAAQRTHQAIVGIAHRAAHAVRAVSRECLDIGPRGETDAPDHPRPDFRPRPVRILAAARHRALHALRFTAHRANHAVARAARIALHNDGDNDPTDGDAPAALALVMSVNPGGDNAYDESAFEDLALDPNALVELDLAAADLADTLTIMGQANLAGALSIHVATDALIAVGDEFDIITAGAISGSFVSVNVIGLPEGLAFQTVYTEQGASLLVTRPADLNADLIINGPDLAQMLGAWGVEGSSPADLNSDGVVNALDLAQILGAWGSAL